MLAPCSFFALIRTYIRQLSDCSAPSGGYLAAFIANTTKAWNAVYQGTGDQQHAGRQAVMVDGVSTQVNAKH